MGLFSFPNINKGVERYRATDGAMLIDVRSTDEYKSYHIQGSINIPLDELSKISVPKDTPLFVYCLSGARSARALSMLKQMGFTNITNIGGISNYKGETVKER